MRNRRFAAFAAALIFLWPAAALGAAAGTATLTGHVPSKIHSATRLARLGADENLDLRLVVKLDQALMDQTMAELYGPSAPANRHYLTTAEFAARFDLARKRQALKDFAAASGLTVDSSNDQPGSLLVRVTGHASGVENAFGIKLYHYRTADGRSVIGHETEPTIPTALAPHLQSIIGLSSFRGPRKPHVRFRGGAQAAVGTVRAPSSGAAAAAPSVNPRTLTGTTGPAGCLGPADIDSIYGLTPSATAGAGQVTALLELDGYDTQDITAYETEFGISPGPTVTFIGVGSTWNGTGTQGNTCGSAPLFPNQDQTCSTLTGDSGQSNSDGGLIEVALDIDMMLALAPGATQLRVYTAFNSDNGAQELEAFQQIATDNVAKTISTSWGLNEADVGGAYMASENAVFFQMASQGQSMFAAAGDNGAYDNAALPETPAVITDDPAAQPYVTGVGGTVLSGSISSHSEAVWNEGCSAPGTSCTDGASGGGIDNYCENGSGSPVTCPGANVYWPLPGYQSGVTGTHSQTYRNVPDVTLNADPNGAPYAVILVNNDYPLIPDGGGLYAIGGTSAASPLWAALTASINHNLAAHPYALLGFANPALYKLGTGATYSTVFNDITSGGNGAYNAAPGYDNASGWGSFKANALISALSVPLPPTGAVSNLTAVTLGMTSIQYSWSTLTGATGYDVKYSTGGPTPNLAIGTGLTSFTQTGLIGDETTGVIVYGENDGIEGPAAFISTATYPAAPAAPTIANVWSTSATFTYSACAVGACSGYALQVSASPTFTGTVFTSSTPTRTLTTLGATGLAQLTGYYARLANLNSLGGPAFGGNTPFNTVTNLVAPISPTFTSISTGSIVFGWGQSTNPGGILYVSSASTSLNFAGALSQTGTTLDAGFSGLTADTSYYFQVAGVGGPWMIDATPVATLALPPTALANAFSGVTAAALTLSWSGANDQPDTLYQADISPSATFASGVASIQNRSPTATFGGLAANTAYYARVKAIGRVGGIAGPIPLGSTTTLVLAPTLPAQPFSGQTTNAFTFTFNATDPAGTNYLVQVATTPGFTTITAAANTTSNSVAFPGLLSNQYYDVQVAALNGAGSPSAFASQSTFTLAAAPLPAGVPITTFTATTFGFAWSPGTLTPGTTYVAQVSLSPTFVPVAVASTTFNAFATLAGLLQNTTYYGRVQTQSANLSTNPNSAFLPVATLATLAIPPTPAGVPFLPISYTSATVAWIPLPLAPPNPQTGAAEGYIVQFSTSVNFTTIAASSAVPPAASGATVTGLNYAAPYFARVGSLNWEGAANFLTLGSTTTALPPLSSGTVAGSGINLSVPQAFPQVFSMNVLVPPAAFPAGTPLSAVANLVPLPAAVTNEASSIVPFGTNLGVVLSANGLQPNAPVTITMAYDFTQIPAGQKESSLALWRYDPNAGQWTLVPSNVSTAGHVLTAQTSHFSTFAPFFVAAGSDVSSVQVWPQPWEIGDASSQYWAPMLNFSNLPPSATVKIFTIVGELVWSGTAAGDGTLTWNGSNRFGRHVASGTYYCTFQNGGQTKTRRLVIIR